MKTFEKRYSEFVFRYRWIVLTVVIVISVAAISGMQRIVFDNNYRSFFNENNPYLLELEKVEKTYAKEDSVLMIVAPKKGDLFKREHLAAIEALTAAAWEVPYSNRVESLTNFQHTFVEGDDLIVRDLVENADLLSDDELSKIKKIALNEVMLKTYLISEKGDAGIVSITITRPDEASDQSEDIMAFVHKIVEKSKKRFPELDIKLSGSIALESDFAKASQNDMMLLVPVMLIALILIIGFSLKSILGVGLIIFVVLLSVLSALGMAGWLHITITPSAAPAPIIILTLAISDCVHIFVTFFEKMKANASKKEAILESIRINFQPVVITSITTAIGFLAMNFADAPPYHALGNIIAIGMVMAFIYALTFLPVMISILPIKNRKIVSHKPKRLDIFIDKIISKKTAVFWGTIAIVILVTAGVLKIKLDDTFSDYLDERYPYRQAFDFMHERHITGENVILFSFNSGETGGISKPEFLQNIDHFVAWAKTQDKVIHVHAITDIIKKLNKNMHQDQMDFYQIPADHQLAAQYLLLYKMSLPFGMDLNNMINVDESSTRVAVRLENPSAKELIAFETEARQWLIHNTPKNMHTFGTGIPIVTSHIAERNITSMLGSSFAALLIISFILIFTLRSLKIGIISIIPNLFPAIMAIGIWGFFIGEAGLTVSVLIAVSIGIIVDDTVHFLSKYQRAKREHQLSTVESIRYSFNTVGSAMVITTIALVVGFSVLALSGLKINATMGILTATTLSIALFMDIAFLPTILLKFEK